MRTFLNSVLKTAFIIKTAFINMLTPIKFIFTGNIYHILIKQNIYHYN